MVIKISHLSQSFGKVEALKDITAEIDRGKMVGLAGPDAAGKTTLMRLLAALLIPTKGTITIEGFDTVRQQKELNAIMGYMPQRFGLYEDLTVIQNLTLYADLHGADKNFEKLLHFTALGPFQKRLAGDLSGGMKQKLGLACTLLCKPKVLLLDEPSVGVDPISRRDLWTLVKELVTKDITVIWSTAYLDEAERCDEVILLSGGSLLYQGSPEALTQKMIGRSYHMRVPAEERRAALRKALQDPRVIDGVIQGDDVRLVSNGARLDYTPVPPRLEDAFMDMLGGCSKKVSPLKKEGVTFVSEPLVEARHLTKRFGSFTAVDDVSFIVKRGEIFGLLGPNGAGKSTIFKMLCGLLKPSSGAALISGTHNGREKIGYMAQKFSLYDNMTVAQNIRFFYGLYPHKTNLVDELESSFGLTALRTTPVKELPIGYKQRLALVCAIMHEPEALFLDEPTSGVDPITRREFWGHINSLVENGVAIIVTTHFMDEAEYCDRIGLVDQGKLLTMGSPEALKKEAGASTLDDAFITLARRQ